MSRVRTPKHLLKLVSESTLIEETARRLEGVVPPENIFVLTNESQLEGFVRPSRLSRRPRWLPSLPAATPLRPRPWPQALSEREIPKAWWRFCRPMPLSGTVRASVSS